METKIDYSSLTPLIKDFELAGGNAEPLVTRMLTTSVNEIQRNTRDLAPHDTGSLQRSILAERGYPSAKVIVNSPYGAAVEFGTRPHFPPIDAITKWANKKGINPYALAFSISKKGTKAHPYFQPGIEKSKPYINSQLNQVGNTILRLMAKGR